MTYIVRKVAVLGAGVMGAQIAAHCANANVPVILFDLPAKEGDPNGIVKKALEGMKRLEPTPFVSKDRALYIDAANYERDLERLKDCDLIIEAIAEKMEWKLDLYKKVAPHVRTDAIFASNTSGLSINALARGVPESLRPRFCGVHFFNPPRYMPLVELIPGAATEARILDELESFLATTLGKGVIRALDTPNFVANRVGVFSMLATMHRAEQFGFAPDLVDALTGPVIGRAKSATYRTCDIVGLDTMAHVVRTMYDGLRDDPWHSGYVLPTWLTALIEKGALGQKTGAGVYRKDGKQIKVFDAKAGDYRDLGGDIDPDVQAMLKLKDAKEKFARLRGSSHPQAQFLWAIFRDVFQYCAYHLHSIADNARDVDFAMRWGFGWNMGPFETWQAAGWREIARAINADIERGEAPAQAVLPAWVFDGRDGVHSVQGSYSAAAKAVRPRSNLAVYRRQLFPERVFGENDDRGTTVFENSGVRMWHTNEEGGKDIAILSFKSKMNSLAEDVLGGIVEAIDRAERDFKGMVIWQPAPPFCVGANLKAVIDGAQAGDFTGLEKYFVAFQQMMRCVKYAQVPVVSAVEGMALGGGCELVLHSARAVVALEASIGLVETAVGLIPGAGGCKEMALRAAQAAAMTQTGDVMNFLQQSFSTILMAKRSRGAIEAREFGLLRESDVVVFHPRELLYVAKQTARAMYDAGYRPKLPPRAVPVAGRPGVATLEMQLVNMRDGGMISEHDYLVGRAVAVALCGGEIEQGTLVDEDWLFAVERRVFMELLKTPNTQERIAYMLANGKPLRN